jgi:hypothetical protein
MRTFAHFDAAGQIRALITVDAPEGISAGLVPEHGIFVDEVKGVDLNPNELDVEAAGEIFKRYKVAPSTNEPRGLVKAD